MNDARSRAMSAMLALTIGAGCRQGSLPIPAGATVHRDTVQLADGGRYVLPRCRYKWPSSRPIVPYGLPAPRSILEWPKLSETIAFASRLAG